MAPTIKRRLFFVILQDEHLALCDMSTYKVTLKITGADGEPIVREVKGVDHMFANGGALNVYSGPQKIVAVFPPGEFAAVEIIEDDE